MEDVLLAGHPYRYDQDERRRSDDHTQRSEHDTNFIGPEAVDGQAYNLAQHHGSLGAGERAFERPAAGGASGCHLVDLFTRAGGAKRSVSLQWPKSMVNGLLGLRQTTVSVPLKSDSRQEDNAGWTANRNISPGEGQQAGSLVNSEGRDVIAVLIAGIHKGSSRRELDVPRVIAHG